MGRKTKKQIEVEEINAIVDAERDRVLKIMQDSDTYSIILDPLIESYLEAFRIHKLMYKRWNDKGFPATQKFENKNGAKNEIKHPLSVQVDIWTDKKLKLLERLGLTNKALSKKVITGGTIIDTTTGTAEKDVGDSDNAVLDFKNKWQKRRN